MGLKKKFFIAFICCLSTAGVRAQPGANDPNGGAKPGAAPISGIEILIGLGGLLGAKKIFDSRTRK